MERDGTRTAAPTALAAHERQQFALYGLMLFRPQIDDTQYRETRMRCFEATRAGAPTTQFCFDERARLVSAANVVDEPQRGAPIAQTFSFADALTHRGVHWPRRMTIAHEGSPYFELTLDAFIVEH